MEELKHDQHGKKMEVNCGDEKMKFVVKDGILKVEGGDGMMDHIYSLCV